MIEARMHLPLGPGENREAALEKLLNTLAEANAVWFSENPDAPCCPACADVRYYDPPVGQCQNFYGAPGVLRRGRATCADAAAYEAGYKLAEGHHAVVVIEPIDGISLHAVVYVDGKRIDPSAELEGAPHRVMPRCEQELAVGNGLSVGSPVMLPSGCPQGQGSPAWLPPSCPSGVCPTWDLEAGLDYEAPVRVAGCSDGYSCGAQRGPRGGAALDRMIAEQDPRGRRFNVGRSPKQPKRKFVVRGDRVTVLREPVIPFPTSPSQPAPPAIGLPPPDLPPPWVAPRPHDPGEPLTEKGTCEMQCSVQFSHGSQAWHDCISGCSVLRRRLPTVRAGDFFRGRRVSTSARAALARARRVRQIYGGFY